MPNKQNNSLVITCGWKNCWEKRDGMTSFVTHLKEHLSAPEPFQCPWTGCKETKFGPNGFKDHIYVHAFHTKLTIIGSEWLKKKKVEKINFDPCEKPPESIRMIRSKLVPFQCMWKSCYDDASLADPINHTFIYPHQFYDHVNNLCDQHVDTLRSRARENGLGTGFACQWQGCTSVIKGSPSKLKAHVKTHTNEREIACPDCGAIFKQIGYLGCHLKLSTTQGDNDSSTESYSRPPLPSELNEAEGRPRGAEVFYQDGFFNTEQGSSHDASMDFEMEDIDETLAYTEQGSSHDVSMDFEMGNIGETLAYTPSTNDNLAQQNQESISSGISQQQDMPLRFDRVEENFNPVPHPEFIGLFDKILVYDIPDSRYDSLSCVAFIRNMKW